MANVQVFQRHAHLAGAVKLEYVNGREGKVAKAVLTAISNTRRGSGDAREEEARHRDPVDAVGQAGRERGRVPGQGLARQHRRPAAQQQLREGRAKPSTAWRSRPRRSTTSTAAPRAKPGTIGGPADAGSGNDDRPRCEGRPAATPAARAPGGACPRLIRSRAGRPVWRLPFEPHSTIEGNHHVLDPDTGHPLCPQHPRDARRPSPARSRLAISLGRVMLNCWVERTAVSVCEVAFIPTAASASGAQARSPCPQRDRQRPGGRRCRRRGCRMGQPGLPSRPRSRLQRLQALQRGSRGRHQRRPLAASAMARLCRSADCRAASSVRVRTCFTATTLAPLGQSQDLGLSNAAS